MAENLPQRRQSERPVPPRGGTAGLPREQPVNAEPFSTWPPGATQLDAEHLVPVSVRLSYEGQVGEGPSRHEVGALVLGWSGDRVLVKVPTRGTWWFAAPDVERETPEL